MSIDDLIVADLALWPHQCDALRRAEIYFESESPRGCLIQMPTGTGKTGVMAVIAGRRSFERPVLVVCPSSALVEQLIGQFQQRFWDKIGADAVWKPHRVLRVLPSEIDELAQTLKASADQRVIIVATIQAIQQTEADGNIEKLHGLVGTILFDEGHREPAPSWANVIRGFGVPTVLFSATPFRGDMKIFDVDDAHIHFLSFEEAVEGGLIRGVEIVEAVLPLDPGEFAVELVARVDALVADGRFTASNKVIVRCASEESVTEMHQAIKTALVGRPDGVLAVHNNFRTNVLDGIFDSVPKNLVARAERFLVHQYMLIEGIDDPNCTILALYEPFSNTRMLVQQVGRLIRHPGPIGEQVPRAYVLSPLGSEVGDDWRSFLKYDTACRDNGGKPFIRNDGKVLEDLVKALPELDYVAGKFRSRIDLDNADIHNDLRFPSAAVAFSVPPDLNMDELQKHITAELAADDRHQAIVGATPDGHCRYHLTLRLTPSPFLSGYLFHAPSLEATIYAKCAGRLFFYDSAGLWINEVDGIGPRINSKSLRPLLPEGSENSISFLNVKNTDLGPLSLRSRSLSARSLERSGVFMGEHLNVVTRATGSITGGPDATRKRRAVGFSRSRVRDGKGTDLTAEEFADWCTEVNKELDAAAEAATIFSRFAAPADVPADTSPINILIDMLEVGGLFTDSGRRNSEIQTEDLCVDVQQDTDPKAPGRFRFTLRVDETDHLVWIDWVPKKRKYWLTSPGMSKIKSKENERISLTRRLNQLQPFRIITADLKHTYVNGDFYALDLDLANARGAGGLVLDLLTPVVGLDAIDSEKGEIRNGHFNDWEDGSLFSFIDKALNPDRGPAILGAPFPNLVCDDLQDEVGDFIGVDEQPSSPRVALIVAKWKKGNPGVSASAFYDVCAQGVKNLAYMKSDGNPLPGAQSRFDSDWRLSSNGLTQTINRRRHGRSSKAFRAAFQRMRTAPSTERSIWLVCSGGMLSLEKLKTEFAKPHPEPHVLQFYHLVVSTYSACQSVGVQLRIFCAE
ncbi:DEAD/DEAH box helicase [Ensifer canadensis]|uniref:DEAD/DEAH box helicase n=1 Tax=Ensifer canadensis TaxID=555315 RepID=UPI0035E3D54C